MSLLNLCLCKFDLLWNPTSTRLHRIIELGCSYIFFGWVFTVHLNCTHLFYFCRIAHIYFILLQWIRELWTHHRWSKWYVCVIFTHIVIVLSETLVLSRGTLALLRSKHQTRERRKEYYTHDPACIYLNHSLRFPQKKAKKKNLSLRMIIKCINIWIYKNISHVYTNIYYMCDCGGVCVLKIFGNTNLYLNY